MRKGVLLVVFAAGLLLAASVSPVSAGVYFGGSVGQASADMGLSDFNDGSVLTGSVDDSDTYMKVYAGWKKFKFFAIEGAWTDIGEVSLDATSDGSGLIYAPGEVTSVSEVDGFQVSALGALPMPGKTHLFAKVGYLFWDASMSISNAGIPGGTLSASDDGEDMVYGAGIVWDYRGPGQLRVEYEQAKMSDIDISRMAVGLSFRFR